MTIFNAFTNQRCISKAITGICLSIVLFFIGWNQSYGQNTSIAYAYPIDNITIDGNLADWPKGLTKYPVQEYFSDSKPTSAADFTAHYQIAYNLKDQSVYLALEVTDDDYVLDTTQQRDWNTQDAHELYIDARHLPFGSGIASYMVSKYYKNINKMTWDPLVDAASWDNVEVVTSRQGKKTVYEWRVGLGDQLYPGRSIGVDHQVYDKDKAGDFSFAAWGKGGYKFRIPNNVGDVVLMKANEGLGTISGRIKWKNGEEEKLPGKVRLTSTQSPALWVDTEVDSLGQYRVKLPAGKYQVSMPNMLVYDEDNVYRTTTQILAEVSLKSRQQVKTPLAEITRVPKPNRIPEKGILHQFNAEKAKELDQFIEAYQEYYEIPGVSLALIKDGKLAYYKTYGVENTFTQKALEENTLFQAASITKTVFAYVVNRLAEKGTIDLDKPLYQYLPFEAMAHDDRYKLITARHVLSHRTGFPNWAYMNPDGKLDIKFTPGTQYGYSGEGFEYLKRVVAHITGKDIEQVLQEELIGPMKLYNMHFSKNERLVKVASHGHFDNIPTSLNISEQPGMAYSMYTEAKAFTKFMIGLMNEDGMQPKSYTHMLAMHSEIPDEEGKEKQAYKEGMGLGIAIRESPYGKVFGHGGNNGDFQCLFEVYKDLKMGYVVFTNSNMGHRLCQDLKEFLVEGKKKK